MRITTNMIRRNYQNNLTSSLGGLEASRKQVETGRKFAKSYENPSAAAKGAVLDRRYARNEDYINTVSNTQKWVESQEDVVMQLNSIAKDIDKNYSLGAMNDPTGKEGREAYAQAIDAMRHSMVNILNTTYGDSFLMAGANGKDAPFELSEDGKTLRYQDEDVNDTDVMEKLKNQHLYVDIGFGMEFDKDGNVVSSSAFDTALPGINVVGYGVDPDTGNNKNLIVLAGEMVELLRADDFDRERYAEVWEQFDKGLNELENNYAEIGAKENLLSSTEEKLQNEKLNIQEQYNDAVGMESSEAITGYMWQQYVYNVSLKIGTSILGQSLLDFMK